MQFGLHLQISRHSWPLARYKYLQRPLETSSLPTLLQYVHRWTIAQTEKLAVAVGLLISQGLASAGCLLSLNKDHLVKNGMQFLINARIFNSFFLSIDVSVNVVTLIFRAYLTDQSMDHLSATLKRGGVKDLLAFFPPHKRENKILEEHFKAVGLPQVGEWWSKKQNAILKDELVKELTEFVRREEPAETIVAAIRTRQDENPIPEADLIQCIWQGCMSNVDWSARPDQIEGLALREVGVCFHQPIDKNGSIPNVTHRTEICTHPGTLLQWCQNSSHPY